ncbi:MAG: hypothetical protein FJ303_09360 [Planctomycetes bacterium]|nr:hypothetical protein [Planctomycetota bacterium]
MPDEHANSVTANAPPLPSGTEFYVIHGGVESGPFSLGELAEQAVIGKLDADDLVKGSDGLWRKAGEMSCLHGFFQHSEPSDKSINELGEFRGVWIPTKVLVVGLCAFVIVLILAAALVVRNFTDERTKREAAENAQRQAGQKAHDAIEEKRKVDDELVKERIGKQFAIAEFVRIDMELERLHKERNKQPAKKLQLDEAERKELVNEIARLEDELARLKVGKPVPPADGNSVIFAKVQKFVDTHPKIYPGERYLGNLEWEFVTRPLRTKTDFSRTEKEELLDFLGRAVKYPPYNADPAFPAIIAELKNYQPQLNFR